MKIPRSLILVAMTLIIPLQAHSQTWQQAAPAGTTPGALTFGGIYKVENNSWQHCFAINPATGGCTCPAGFIRREFMRQMVVDDYDRVTYYCYRN